MSAAAAGTGPDTGLVGRYLELGLRLGRHVEGLVDAYYGPAELSRRVAAEPVWPPGRLVAEARALVAGLDAGEPLDGPWAAGGPGWPAPAPEAALPGGGGPGGAGSPGVAARITGADRAGGAGPGVWSGGADGAHEGRRRRWLRAQALGLLTTARILDGAVMGYADEVQACYGVRPERVPEEVLAAAHRRLDAAIPGTGPLAERYVAWKEAQAVAPDVLPAAIASLAEDLRERTAAAFGLPEGESVRFELVNDRPWSGFNYYLGGLRSRVAINVDLPVLSTSLAHLVAHEAYPGHHTEHCRKEVGLVRRRHQAEEAIFLVGTPQCLLAEGLADLGLEVVVGPRPEAVVAEHLRPLGIPYDAGVVAEAAGAADALGSVRANAAFRLHEDGADPEVVVAEVCRWALLPRPRAEKVVAFLLDPTWRAYVTCYVDGLRLCRAFVAGSPSRFSRLLTDQLVPADLAAQPGGPGRTGSRPSHPGPPGVARPPGRRSSPGG